MPFLFCSCFRKVKQEKTIQNNKEDKNQLNVITVLKKKQLKHHVKQPEYQLQKQLKFRKAFQVDTLDYNQIQSLAWSGIPQKESPGKYCFDIVQPINNPVWNILNPKDKITFQWPNNTSKEKDLMIRTRYSKSFNPMSKGLYLKWICSEKLLFVWHMRHPASGYVQGINDLATPFILVFFDEIVPLDMDKLQSSCNIQNVHQQILRDIQADTYWCLGKLIEHVTNNYVKGFGGIKMAFKQVENILKKTDKKLYDHLEKEKVDFFCVTFRQISTLLLRYPCFIRMFTPKLGHRLFDSYFSYQQTYPNFVLFVLSGIFIKHSQSMRQLHFDQLMKFFQNMPTKKYTEDDLQTILSQAYIYQQTYKD